MRSEREVRLRIDLLEGQASTLAKLVAKAMKEHNEEAVRHYSEKLLQRKSRVEELIWVLGTKIGQSILESRVTIQGADVTVRDILDKLRDKELRMDDLALDVQALVRRGALEMQNAMKHTT